MQKMWHLLLWLVVNIVFGFLQLIYDIANKALRNIEFDTSPLILGGGLLFFSSGFVISVAFDRLVIDYQSTNKILFTFKHIIIPFFLILAIIMIYSTSVNLPKNITPQDSKIILISLYNANVSVLIGSIIYGIYSKYEQLT